MEKDLDIIKNRLYELKDLSISAMQNRNYKLLHKYSLEIVSLEKKLKKMLKNAKKRENKEALSWF